MCCCALFCGQEVHVLQNKLSYNSHNSCWMLLLNWQCKLIFFLYFPHNRRCYEWTPLQLMTIVREKEPTAGRNLCWLSTLAQQVYGVMFTPNRATSKGPAAKGWGNCGIEKGEYSFKLWLDVCYINLSCLYRPLLFFEWR